MIERLTKGAVSIAILLCTVGVAPGSGSPMRTTGKRSEFRSAEMAAAYAAYTRSVAGALRTSTAIPAFARKYGLRCSACHTVWPELNAFGQRFKDNGYQLGNDRDSPIWQSNGYWPIAMRTTPQLAPREHHEPDHRRGPGRQDGHRRPGSTSPASTS